MKLQFLLMSADEMGGTERAILTQADHLARRHDVEIISVFRTLDAGFFTPGPGVRVRYLVDRRQGIQRPVRETDLDDATCHALASTRSRLIEPGWERTANRLTDLELEFALRDSDADVLVSSAPALMAVATAFAPSRVVTVHQEHRPAELRGPTGEPLYQCVPNLDALVVLTERTRGWFAETFGASAPRLEVIRNAIPAGYRPRSSLANPVVVLGGRLVPEKQVDHAIRAFAQVADVHPDWVLKIFGDGPLLGELRRLVANLDLHDNVQVCGPTGQMAHEWAKGSIAVLTSRDGEALPLVLLEAFAAGVPAVAYDIQTGPAEIITHGRDGFLVAPGDHDALAQSLIKLIGDADLRREFGAEAARSAQRYDIDAVMAEWETLYAELVAEPAHRRARTKADRSARWLVRTGGSGFAPAVPRTRRVVVGPDLPTAERRIQDGVAGLVRAGGWLSTVSDDMTPADVAAANLELVADVLDRHGFEYRLVRDQGLRHRLALAADLYPAVLRAFAEEFRDRPVYAETMGRRGGASALTLAALVESIPQAADAVLLRVFRPVVSTSRTLRYGPAFGCDVEFWTPAETEDALVAARRTLLGGHIPHAVMAAPATTRVREREYPSVAVLGRTLVYDVDFPIDVVYTWVDGSDPDWLAAKNTVLAEQGRPPVPAADGAARFRDRDELRYSLRSIDMYAPWVRHIYLVTAGQVPEWLDTSHPRITVVDHRDLFAGRGRLPTFNSHAIESQLHHIGGLSEQYIYFNDDMFLGRALSPGMFFHAGGLAKYFQSPTAVPMAPVSPEDDFNFSAGKNNRRLVEREFGRTLTHAFLHAPYPMRRSVGRDLDARFPAEVAQTAASQLRWHTDISVASSLHHYVGYLTGAAVPGSIRVCYVDTSQPEQHPQLTRLLAARGYDAFCLNDTHHGPMPEQEQAVVVGMFLESYFPVASQFERGSRRNRHAH